MIDFSFFDIRKNIQMGHTLCMLQNTIFKKTADSARSTQLLNLKKESYEAGVEQIYPESGFPFFSS